MNNDINKRAMHPVTAGQVPRPPKKCAGQFYTIRASDTLSKIALQFGVTVQQILAANKQIVNPNVIFVGQVICIPTGGPGPSPDGQLRVLSFTILSETGQPLHAVNGFVPLPARVQLRATFSEPVFRAFFFLEPTGTEACEQARLIGVNCPGSTTAEVIWHVPPGTSGRVFVIGCTNHICAKSDEISVVRNH